MFQDRLRDYHYGNKPLLFVLWVSGVGALLMAVTQEQTQRDTISRLYSHPPEKDAVFTLVIKHFFPEAIHQHMSLLPLLIF